MYLPSADLLALKIKIFQEYLKCILNAYSKLILNVHVFSFHFLFFHQVSHSVPAESDQSISTSSNSLLLSLHSILM